MPEASAQRPADSGRGCQKRDAHPEKVSTVDIGEHLARRARQGNEPRNSMSMSTKELKSDLKAHRESDYDDLVGAEQTAGGLRVIREVVDANVPWTRWGGGVPVAPVVQEQQRPIPGDRRGDPPEGPAGASDPVEDQDGEGIRVTTYDPPYINTRPVRSRKPTTTYVSLGQVSHRALFLRYPDKIPRGRKHPLANLAGRRG